MIIIQGLREGKTQLSHKHKNQQDQKKRLNFSKEAPEHLVNFFLSQIVLYGLVLRINQMEKVQRNNSDFIYIFILNVYNKITSFHFYLYNRT